MQEYKLNNKKFGEILRRLGNAEYVVDKVDGVSNILEIKALNDWHDEGILGRIVLEEYNIKFELEDIKNPRNGGQKLFDVIKEYLVI